MSRVLSIRAATPCQRPGLCRQSLRKCCVLLLQTDARSTDSPAGCSNPGLGDAAYVDCPDAAWSCRSGRLGRVRPVGFNPGEGVGMSPTQTAYPTPIRSAATLELLPASTTTLLPSFDSDFIQTHTRAFSVSKSGGQRLSRAVDPLLRKRFLFSANTPAPEITRQRLERKGGEVRSPWGFTPVPLGPRNQWSVEPARRCAAGRQPWYLQLHVVSRTAVEPRGGRFGEAVHPSPCRYRRGRDCGPGRRPASAKYRDAGKTELSPFGSPFVRGALLISRDIKATRSPPIARWLFVPITVGRVERKRQVGV